MPTETAQRRILLVELCRVVRNDPRWAAVPVLMHKVGQALAAEPAAR